MGNIKNLKDMKFGRLKVIEEAGRDKHGRALWKCICDCGKEVYVSSNKLLSSRTKSCGCLHSDTARERSKNKALDLTNQIFDKLKIIKKITNIENLENKWVCECECGEIITTSTRALRSNKINSCSQCRSKTVSKNKTTNIVGVKFNKLTVLERVYNDRKGTMWLCQCDCGNTTITDGSDLKQGKTKSCGCYGKEMSVQRLQTHGETKSKLYNVWRDMKKRTNNKNNQAYKNYGERGITVCDEWLNSYENFRDWALENGYKEGLSIDRINVNGNYSPDNCRWATDIIQSNNKRNNIHIFYKGKTQTLSNWCRELKLDYNLVHHRLKANWSIEIAFTKPSKRKNT